MVSLGTKPDGSPWRVGVQHPRREGELLGVVLVCGESVVTSGDYQRYFVDDCGRRQHHILDPATGWPAASGLTSVTIVSPDSCAADALSTAVFVAGLERGVDMLRALPGAEALIVDVESRVYVTRGLLDRFSAAETSGVTVVS